MPAATTPKQKVKIAGTTSSVEVAPGERYAGIPADIVPKVGIVRWTPVGDGTYRPRLQVLDTWVRTSELPQFGIHIPRDTIGRLGAAGFIEISQLSPRCPSVTMESVLAHIESCKDPEFWTEARVAKYRKTFWQFKNT